MYKNLKFLLESYGATEPLYFGPSKDKSKWLKWLKKQNHEVHEDGSVSIKHSVDLMERKLTRIPFNFKKVNGAFICAYNQLTTLEGCPEVIGTHFSCDGNLLTSLEGGPKQVESYRCSGNRLVSLKGAPEVIPGLFDCSANLLTTLEGAPKEVGTFFRCNLNKLTSLKGAPEKVLQYMLCNDNPLQSLEGAPEVVGKFYSDQFSDEDYRKFVKKRKYVEGSLDKELDVSALDDFGS